MLLLLVLAINASAIVVEAAKRCLLGRSRLPPARRNDDRIVFPRGSPGVSICTPPFAFPRMMRLRLKNHIVRQTGRTAARLVVGRRLL